MAKKGASLTDLAQQLNVSVSTVSRALNGHSAISEATVKRVAALAKELGYQPNHPAAGLRRGRSNLLGVVEPHIEHDLHSAPRHLLLQPGLCVRASSLRQGPAQA